jgi:hypothetical protein
LFGTKFAPNLLQYLGNTRNWTDAIPTIEGSELEMPERTENPVAEPLADLPLQEKKPLAVRLATGSEKVPGQKRFQEPGSEKVPATNGTVGM